MKADAFTVASAQTPPILPADGERLARAEAALGVRFTDRALLKLALTHRSHINELTQDLYDSNERLEFLGDALLGFLTADWLYARFPDLPEGDLTARRVALIRTGTLAHWARQLGLGPLLYLSKGETELDALSDRVLANAFESALAAIYLDAGLERARAFLYQQLDEADAIMERRATENYKGRLQELAQDPQYRRELFGGEGGMGAAGARFTPVYDVVAQGAVATGSAFTVEVLIDGQVFGRGSGASKRVAEQAAARHALMQLGRLAR